MSGSNLFVLNSYTGTIGEYTTSGETVNASLIPVTALSIAVGGDNPISCGTGPELALVAPLLMWLRSRRRRRAS
ncbi:MAG TPA: hypothetical protein VK714_23505 [Myxococcota bacterium]|nr:hypothetical protein [Myxococcota bacterium]